MEILLATAVSSVAERWQGLLTTEKPLECVTSLAGIKAAASKRNFEVILLHRSLIDLQACAALHNLFPLLRIFLLSDQPNEEEGLISLRSGIVGYGNTYISRERLAEALHVVATGGVWLGQKLIQHLIMESINAAAAPAATVTRGDLSVLTPMERKVAKLVARGMTNLAIANELAITERTVKAHLTAIYEKMHIGNRLSLALLVNRG